jgi:murein DD-endopeptidase MepM/ murein hydrolase activator NlpD
MSRLNAIAKALNDGDLALAWIGALQLGLPELADGAAVSRMATADRLLKAGFNPDELRDSHGRWTTGGVCVQPQLVQVPGYPDSISPVPDPKIRQTDPYGAGGFNRDRDKGRRHHHGVDLVASPGTVVTSPVSGRIAIFDPYGRDETKWGHFSAVQITTDDGYVVRVMYVDRDDLENGQRVEAGYTLGTAEDLSDVYPPKANGKGMTNHVHFDIRLGRTYLDPTPMVDAWQNEL